MPRSSKRVKASRTNGASNAVTFAMLDDMNISVIDLIQKDATEFVWKKSNRNYIQADRLTSWICWFENDPNSMVAPLFGPVVGPWFEETYMEHNRPHLMDILSDLVDDHDDDFVDFEEEDNSDAIVEEKIKLLGEQRWRSRGCNSNRRGAGTSKTTFYRNQKKAKGLATNASKHSQDVRT